MENTIKYVTYTNHYSSGLGRYGMALLSGTKSECEEEAKKYNKKLEPAFQAGYCPEKAYVCTLEDWNKGF